MYHLVITACLISDPAICGERLLPAADAASHDDCLLNSDQLAQDWIARHKTLAAKDAAHCVETAELPALEVSEIAKGVFAHIGKTEALSVENAGRIANLSFIIGESVAVIDAGGSRAEGEALYAAIRQKTDLPISHLILTHMHPDHIFGAEVFSEAGATIVANARMAAAVQARRATWQESIPAQIGAAAFMGTQIVTVDQTIAAPTTLAIGARQLMLSPAPSAHTDNDLTVYDPASGVFFAGDLLFHELTPVIDGSLLGWLDWMDSPAPQPQPRLILPGHGPVQSDWDGGLAPQRSYLEALRTSVSALIDQGVALSAAIPRTVKALEPEAAGWQDFEDTTARNAATAYSELEWQ